METTCTSGAKVSSRWVATETTALSPETPTKRRMQSRVASPQLGRYLCGRGGDRRTYTHLIRVCLGCVLLGVRALPSDLTRPPHSRPPSLHSTTNTHKKRTKGCWWCVGTVAHLERDLCSRSSPIGWYNGKRLRTSPNMC